MPRVQPEERESGLGEGRHPEARPFRWGGRLSLSLSLTPTPCSFVCVFTLASLSLSLLLPCMSLRTRRALAFLISVYAARLVAHSPPSSLDLILRGGGGVV